MTNFGYLAAIPATEIVSSNESDSNNRETEESTSDRNFLLLGMSLLIIIFSLLASLFWLLMKEDELSMGIIDLTLGGATSFFLLMFIVAIIGGSKEDDEETKTKTKTKTKTEAESESKFADCLFGATVVLVTITSFVLSALRGITVYSIATGFVILYFTIFFITSSKKEKTSATS